LSEVDGLRARVEQLSRELVEADERFASVVTGVNDGIWDWDLGSGLVFYSPRWKSMLGYAEHEVGDALDDWFTRVHPEDIDLLRMEWEAHLHGRRASFHNEYRIRDNRGNWRWMYARGVALRDDKSKPRRVAGSQTDIHERRRVEHRLAHEALHDSLTGLPNRQLLFERLSRCIKRNSRRSDYLYAVLFFDLDRFKVVNESLGHVAGDGLLRELAERLRAGLRPGDTVARLGGDEFALILEDIRGVSDAVRVSRRVQEAVAQPFRVGEREIFTRASIGIALGKPEYEQPEDVLRDADAAMYRAKANGRDRHEVFDQAMHEAALYLLHMENDLRRAIEREEFAIHYQPIVDLDSGKVNGFEALLRWRHPERGLLHPAAFLPVAEEAGLMVGIDRWVLGRACRQLATWRDKGSDVLVSVNLVTKQFEQPDLVAAVKTVLKESSVDPAALKIEITEDTLREDAGILKTMQQLKHMDIHLYIDDFGAGYSSLSRLQKLPVDILKIDRSFVKDLQDSDDDREIVRTIVTLAQNLQMGVIAEGVELEAQVVELKRLGCRSAQGFLFAEPLSAPAADELVQAGARLRF